MAPAISEAVLMAVSPEERRILKALQQGESMQGVVDFRVPYDRILRYLRKLLDAKLIERTLDGHLLLTADGAAALAASPTTPPSARSTADVLAGSRIAPVDPKVVRVPGDDVG